MKLPRIVATTKVKTASTSDEADSVRGAGEHVRWLLWRQRAVEDDFLPDSLILGVCSIGSAMAAIARRFWKLEGPTWILAVAVYGAWFLLVWYHSLIPWWLMIPLGAYVFAWQFSLQHEMIHGFRGVPAWFRFVIAFPPLGSWFTYPLYRKSHSIHHWNTYLTVLGMDTESYNVRQAEWARASRIWKGVLLVNQTLAGRLLIGSLLRLWKLRARARPRGCAAETIAM